MASGVVVSLIELPVGLRDLPGVRELPGLRELDGLTVPDLRIELAEVRRMRAALDARVVDIVARLEATLTAVGSPIRAVPEAELVAHGGLSRREAGDMVRRAHVIEDAPVVGEALASGDLTTGHVDAISRGLTIAGESRDALLEKLPELIESMGSMTVPEFAAEVTRAAKGVVSDGGLSRFEDQRRSTYLKVWNDAAGMVNVRGMFDPETGAIVQSRLNAQVETMFHAGDREVPVVHHPWVDANDFRRAHALITLLGADPDGCTRPGGKGLSGRTLPGSGTASRGGVREGISGDGGFRDGATGAGHSSVRSGGSCRSDVVVHIDLETLTNGLTSSSTHRTVFGADLPVATIRRIACEANIIPVVLNGAGMPLDIGRGQRLASAAQRRALEAVHDTCAFESCGVAFHACQIHHIDYWEHGGPTNLDNMVPLCSRHHHAAHEGGWTLTLEPGTRHLDARPPNLVSTRM